MVTKKGQTPSQSKKPALKVHSCPFFLGRVGKVMRSTIHLGSANCHRTGQGVAPGGMALGQARAGGKCTSLATQKHFQANVHSHLPFLAAKTQAHTGQETSQATLGTVFGVHLLALLLQVEGLATEPMQNLLRHKSMHALTLEPLVLGQQPAPGAPKAKPKPIAACCLIQDMDPEMSASYYWVLQKMVLVRSLAPLSHQLFHLPMLPLIPVHWHQLGYPLLPYRYKESLCGCQYKGPGA